MNRIFKIGIIHKKVSKNPVEGLATSTKTTYKAIKITPAQTLLDPAFFDGEHAALHSGVLGGGNSTSKLRSALAPLG